MSCLKKNSLSFLRNSSTHWGQIKIISEVCFYNQGRQWYCTWWDVKMPSECLVPYKTFSTNSASLFVYVLLSFQVQIFLPFSMFFFFSPAVYTFYHWNTCFWIEPTDFYPALLSHKPTLACSGSLHALLQEFVFKKKKPTNNNKKTNKQKQQKPAIFTERPGSRPLHSLPTLD